MRITATLALPALALLLASGCSAPDFGIEAAYGQLDARGELGISDEGEPAVENELSDLGLSGEESTVGLRADFKWGLPHLTFATQSAGWSGTGSATDLGDISGSDVAVDSDLDLGLHRLILTFDLIPGETFELGLGFGISALDVDAVVQEQGSSTREEIDEILPIPVLALRAGLSIWRFDLEALVTGLSLQADGDEATYIDADLAGRLLLFDAGAADGLLTVGYRYISLDAEFDDDKDSIDLDMSFDGPYVGLRVRF